MRGLWLLAVAFTFAPHAQTATRPPGGVDRTFHSALAAYSNVACVGLQSDGRYVVGGDVVNPDPLTVTYFLTRLNPDGSLDTTFTPASGVDGAITCLNVQGDGKIILGGSFTTFNGTARSYLTRLNADGSPDMTFHPDASVHAAVSSLAVQGDGKVVVCNRTLTRLNADGSADATFIPALAADDYVSLVTVQSDGKIVLAGFFDLANSYEKANVTRLNADGSADPGFTPPPELYVNNTPGSEIATGNFVYSMALQRDGKIVLAGGASALEGGTYDYFQRLNADGTNDPTVAYSGYGGIRCVGVEDNGKIILGPASWDVVRLNADGSPDAAFDSARVGSSASCVVVQGDDKIVLGGSASTGDGIPSPGMVRVYGGDVPLPAETVDLSVRGDGVAVEGGAKAFVFVTRTGDASVPLTVAYKTKGTAKAGVDFKPLSGSVTIPPGEVKAKIKIKALADSPGDGARKLKIVLLPPTDNTYEIGTGKVKVTIVGK